MNSDPNLGGVEDCVIHAATPAGDEVNPDLVPGTNRYKPFRSPNPSLYQQSPLYLSQTDIDAKENPEALFGQREPNYAILHEKPEHRVIIYLKAQGNSHVQIAEITRRTVSHVSNVCRQPWAIPQILALQKQHGHDAVAEVLQRTALKAATALEKVLDGQDERDSEGRAVISPAAIVAASKEILDRKYGKSKQPIGNDGLANLDMSDKSDEELMKIVMGGNTNTGNS